LSHFRSFPTKFTDAEILKITLRDLGICVSVDAAVRGYRGQQICADIVAVLEGEYDIGWERNPDGSFDLIADLLGVAKKHNLAVLIESINQKYILNKTLCELKQPGLQNANVKLVVQNMS
jgi:predicted metal-dependent phosphotriesterase family hydrolase